MENILRTIQEAISFSDALSGAIGAIATLAITYHWSENDKREHAASLRNAMRTELAEARSYFCAIMEGIEDSKTRNRFAALSVTQNYTTVYDGNAEFVGTLSKGTASAVVKSYILLKSIEDLLQSYASICQKLLYAQEHSKSEKSIYESEATYLQTTIKEKRKNLVNVIDDTIRLLS